MEFSTPTASRSATPTKRLVIPQYEDSPRAFGGRGTLSHLAAPSTNAQPAIVERRMPSARSFSPNYRSKTPLFFSRRPGTADRPRMSTLSSTSTSASVRLGGGQMKKTRPSTADNALREVPRHIRNRPGTADRQGFSNNKARTLPSQESTSYSKAQNQDSVKENFKRRSRPVSSPENSRIRSIASSAYPTLGGTRPHSSRRAKGKAPVAQHTVPVGSLIKAKAINTLQVYKKGIIDVIKDYNAIRDEAGRKQILLETLEGTSKELDRQGVYTASVAAPDNEGKMKVKVIAQELADAKESSHEIGVYHQQFEFVKKRIENSVIQSKQKVDELTTILTAASNCKTDVDLECRSVKDQKHLAIIAVKDSKVNRAQKEKHHSVEIAALRKVIENQKHWTKCENAWRKRETERPKRNEKNSQKSLNTVPASFIEKSIASKMESLKQRIGLEEEDLFEYIADFPNKVKEFEMLKESTEARLEEVSKELRYTTRELSDYKRDLRQASTKKLSELENKLSIAQEKLNDKTKEQRSHQNLHAGFQTWANEILQRTIALVDEPAQDSKVSSEDLFQTKLKIVEARLLYLMNQSELKGKTLNASPETDSPVVWGADEHTRKTMQSDAIASPLLGPYNIRIPTVGDQSPSS